MSTGQIPTTPEIGKSIRAGGVMTRYAGVYSTFLLHARRAGERYNIDPRAILVELGRRKAVAGQEDWILDVALDLARQREQRIEQH